ncbi:MAG: DUF262 domain-containing protein [Verrucomicrobiales bacterium]|nr:DUF262 domain-containing protein [Verrucomicrobiales bacterium]
MKQPENQSRKYEALFNDIDQGRIKVPQFQREFVWTKEQTARLIDSIIKGYPVGTFILWKTRERLRHFRNLGNVELPEPPAGDSVQYVLDGQQRITSLYAVRKGLILTKEGKEIDYKDICINLEMDPEQDEETVFPSPPEGAASISVHELLDGDIAALAAKYPDNLNRISQCQHLLTGYDFSTIAIDEYPIDVACDVFTRINTGGKELTLFEIMVAKTYDAESEFDLSREYDELIESETDEKDLSSAGFQTIPSVTVLQCIAAQIAEEITRKDILKLSKSDVIKEWKTVKTGIFTAVDYLRTHVSVRVSRMLPYNSLLVPLSFFFIRNGFQPPSPAQDRWLKQFIFWASLSNRYTSSVETKMATDLKKIQHIVDGEAPDYSGEELKLDLEDLMWTKFRVGDAFCKAILCLLAQQHPKSFLTNADITLDNSWLKSSASRNYHHFFPRAYLKKRGFTADEANALLNITLVDDFLNKNVIRAKAPADYIATFAEKNSQLGVALHSHLIGDTVAFGIESNDYRRFLRARSEWVLQKVDEILRGEG